MTEPGRALATTLVAAVAFLLPGPAHADHANGHRDPTGPAPVEFAEDFTPPDDAEYGFPLGGFGGIRRGAPLARIPIVFVHGNQADAQNWHVVRDRLKETAGYTDQELWALSYGGLGYVGGSAPVEHDGGEAAYVAEHPQAGVSGNPQNNEVNVPDLIAFLDAVQDHTGAERVHVVAHSLGVTIVRRAMVVDPGLRSRVAAVVAIAGANHGTTVCRGAEDSYYGCDEIAPGTRWLARLNAHGEARGPTRWMTVYDGTGIGDAFYGPEDAQSPRLEGAEINREWPHTSHNDLRVAPEIVDDWVAFLADVEATLPASGPSSPVSGAPVSGASVSGAPPPSSEPAAGTPTPATGGGLAAPAVLALLLVGARRRRREFHNDARVSVGN